MSIEIDFDNFKAGRVPNEINNFSALVFLLIAKADPQNIEKLRLAFPDHVRMYEEWQAGPASEN